MSVDGPARGSASQRIGNVQRSFRVHGWVRSEGGLRESYAAIQAFDGDGRQVGWQNLVNAAAAPDWVEFSAMAGLPPEAATASLVLTFDGEGSAWLDEVKIAPAPRVFRATESRRR
jgi:hypothetical protein